LQSENKTIIDILGLMVTAQAITIWTYIAADFNYIVH